MHHRDAKRQQVLERRRRTSAPVVVAVLPLSDAVDAPAFRSRLIDALESAGVKSATPGAGGGCMEVDLFEETGVARPIQMSTLLVQGKGKMRVTLLPPPLNRNVSSGKFKGPTAVDNEQMLYSAVLNTQQNAMVLWCVAVLGGVRNE